MLTSVLAELRERLAGDSERLQALAGPVSIVHLGSHWPGRAVYAVFARGSAAWPTVVLKVDNPPAPGDRLAAEWAFMQQAQTIPALAERMAQPLALWRSGRSQILAQSGLPGVSLTVALRRRGRPGPRSSAREHALVGDWLAALHTGTTQQTHSVIEPDGFRERLDRALPSDVVSRARVLDVAAAAAERVGPLRVPTRRLHGDLGPSNCLVHRGRVWVIDWEGSTYEGSPLADLLLFLNHYARAVPLAGHRLPALSEGFRRAFVGDDWLGQLTRTTWRQFITSLGLPSESADHLILRTLTDLALGEAPTAHAARLGTRSNWTGLLAIYAAETT